MMDIEFVGFIIDTAGELFIAITALMVSKRILQERRIDRKVVRVLTIEETMGWLGVAMVIVGSYMQAVGRFF